VLGKWHIELRMVRASAALRHARECAMEHASSMPAAHQVNTMEGVNTNLLSISQMFEQGYTVKWEPDECSIVKRNASGKIVGLIPAQYYAEGRCWIARAILHPDVRVAAQVVKSILHRVDHGQNWYGVDDVEWPGTVPGFLSAALRKTILMAKVDIERDGTMSAADVRTMRKKYEVREDPSGLRMFRNSDKVLVEKWHAIVPEPEADHECAAGAQHPEP
jgi:hypothetical protein